VQPGRQTAGALSAPYLVLAAGFGAAGAAGFDVALSGIISATVGSGIIFSAAAQCGVVVV
jgi:hypothetical protein